MAITQRAKALAPFAVVSVAAMISLLITRPAADAMLWVDLAGVLVLVGLAAVFARIGGRLALLAPLLCYVIVALARDSGGGTDSGLGAVVLLPTLWIILYGNRFQLIASVPATVAVFWVPLLMVGPPRYDLNDWRRGALWALVVAVICPSLQSAVTRLRQAERRNAELAGQLSAVLDAATDHAIVSTDMNNTVTLFSHGAERMLGYRAEEVVGRATPTLFHEDAETAARAADLGMRAGPDVYVAGARAEEPLVRAWTYRRKDGSKLRARLAITPLIGSDGAQSGWIGVFNDITEQEAAAQRLSDAERRWRTLLNNLPDITVLAIDGDLRYQVALGGGADQGRQEQLAGRTLFETSNAENIAVLEPVFRSAVAGRKAEAEVGAAADRVLLVTAVPLTSRSSDAEAMVLIQDVTVARRRERQLREAQLQHARDRFARLFAEGPHGMVLLDESGVITQTNPALCAIFGLADAELLGRPVSDVPGLARHEPSQMPALRSGQQSRIADECTLNPGTAEEVHLAITSVALRGDTGDLENVLITVVDVSERRRFEEQLAHLADHDPLTGLANRRKFDAELTSHLDRSRRYGSGGALLLLDLDNFKSINDTLGHGAGDQLIVSVADVLRQRMRTSDVVARLGGDEFAVLLPYASREGAEVVARDIVALVRDKVRLLSGDRPRRVTASVGVVLLRNPEMTASEVLAMADMTMYDAKEAGRDQYVLYSTSDEVGPRSRARVAWAERISCALEDNRFVVHAQPVQDLRTGRLTGAELLVRMLDDDGELIPPGRFLYIAERTGQILDIDKFMVSQAVELLAEVQLIDPDFSIEVNLSGHSLGNRSLAEHITAEIRRAGVVPRGLVFEITETAAVSNIESARSFAEQIGALGCRFALDDFGAGFGSFYYLKHLLFDFVKIDGEFVAKSPGSRTDQLILTSIVGIASGLGKETIAEFVTDEDVCDVVTRLGVDYGQGYHIARPEPLLDLLGRLRHTQTAATSQTSACLAFPAQDHSNDGLLTTVH